MIEEQWGVMLSVHEEIAYRYKWISEEKLLESAAKYGVWRASNTMTGGKLR